MPELPDVEAYRRVLASCARGRRIERVEVYDAGVLRDVSGRRLRRELKGRRFREPERHGKWLLARTDGPTVLLHFGMTGRLDCHDADDPPHPHDRVAFTVTGGSQLRYRDQRKLKGLWLADDDGVARTLESQGPDAATVGRAEFDAVLDGRRGGIKSLLTNQSALAGLGNLLADEVLWRSGLAPTRRAGELSGAERQRLYGDMRRVLRSAVRAGRVPSRPSWLTGHRDDTDPACPRCGGPLRRGRVAGRGTVWCPRCQSVASGLSA
ncbi:Fpg/Nei family DNA glycosylase [Streptomyces armeniacus]|uniref:Fpg/Nei family DNA glycosylase n=1 Tax=Streptomyces armeniacus TaxID=83291 RepID=A0A345XM87_9ACTN|nr:DNA-formamidopyrimidine glycosylase family protein [Streptomyces armeniacus]AXK32753.1 Fpg/Nei family DNA glycosylase [Streptomyces armeniacus]